MDKRFIIQNNNSCYLKFKVRTGMRKFRIALSNDSVEVSVREVPYNNKANLEILKEFSRIMKRPVCFTGCTKTKQKCIVIENMTCEELMNILRQS